MKRFRVLVAVSAVAIVATACGQNPSGGGGGGGPKYAEGGTFTDPVSADPGNLNPLTAVLESARSVDAFAYDTLINLTSSGTVQPQLASSWQATPTSAVFTLRKDVTCSDGSTLTASDVAANFNFVKDPKNQSPVIPIDLPSPAYTVTADDSAGTVTINMPTPYAFLLQGAGSVPIVCKKGLTNPAQLAHTTDGTGPFVVTGYVADDHLTMTVRKDYKWGPNGASTAVPGFPKQIVFKVIQNNTTAENLLLSNKLNLVATVGPDSARLLGHGYQDLSILSGPDELWFNQRQSSPVSDLTVRKALTSALNLDQLTKVDTQNTGERAESLVVAQPALCGEKTVGDTLPPSNLDTAKSLLDGDGWTVGAGGVRTKNGHQLAITVAYGQSDDATKATMELISQQWQQLGVAVTLKGQDANAFQVTLFTGSAWDVAWLGASIANPSQLTAFVSGPEPPAGTNFSAIHNANYDSLATSALSTTGPAGCGKWDQAAQSLFRDLDLVPIANRRQQLFLNKATASLGAAGIVPTSLRMLAS